MALPVLGVPRFQFSRKIVSERKTDRRKEINAVVHGALGKLSTWKEGRVEREREAEKVDGFTVSMSIVTKVSTCTENHRVNIFVFFCFCFVFLF